MCVCVCVCVCVCDIGLVQCVNDSVRVFVCFCVT